MAEFEVKNGFGTYPVDLQAQSCACKMWDITGIPCVHVMTCFTELNIEPDEFVSHWYTKEMWVKTYSYRIRSQYGSSLWKKVDGIPILPPKGMLLTCSLMYTKILTHISGHGEQCQEGQKRRG